MIPGRIDSAAPASERRVFDLLRADPDSTGWTVLHSLGLASRGRKPYGEIDFVILAPGLGILCLEVKGGRVRCQDGVWYTRNRDGRESLLAKSPVMQAREGMFALMKAIRGHFGEGSSEAAVLVGSGVLFPDVPAPPAGIEAESWEFIDRDALTRRPISYTVRTILREQLERLGEESAGAEPTVLKTIRSFLRPDFDVVVARGTTIDRAEEQIIRLTQSQFDVLDNLELNRRCVVVGAAGTGKTLVAVELARRAKAAGLRPVVLCFNRLLGRWLEAELGPGMTFVGSYHRVLRRLINDSCVRNAFSSDAASAPEGVDFREWPMYVLEALGERGPIGNLLVLDEAQDLANDADLCVLDGMLEGGLAGGRWVMLGDFTRQAIFGGACADMGFEGFEQVLRQRAPYFTMLRLNVNCRNTRQIAEETAMLSGFETLPYRLNTADGPAVDFRFWSSPEEQGAQLGRSIADLLRDGVKPHQITILSPLRFENSVASQLPGKGQTVADISAGFDHLSTGVVRFATIQSFKGMETAVAVLSDLRGIEDVVRQALLYVGMSRARTYLVMHVHKSFRTHLDTTFRRRLHEVR